MLCFCIQQRINSNRRSSRRDVRESGLIGERRGVTSADQIVVVVVVVVAVVGSSSSSSSSSSRSPSPSRSRSSRRRSSSSSSSSNRHRCCSGSWKSAFLCYPAHSGIGKLTPTPCFFSPPVGPQGPWEELVPM